MPKMSKQATAALINAGTNRQGAAIKADDATLAELVKLNLIGPERGLTRKGTIERERAMNAALDAAF
jgi:hypothetical protein